MEIDPLGLDSFVFYDPNFMSGAREMAETEAKALESYFGTPTHIIDIYSEEGFINNWNAMGSNGENIDGVVLLFHANADLFQINVNPENNQYSFITQDTFDKVESKTIWYLVSFGCSTGETIRDDNMAMKIFNTQNITGGIIASDGAVIQNYFNGNHVFHSHPGDNISVESVGKKGVKSKNYRPGQRDGFKFYTKNNGNLNIRGGVYGVFTSVTQLLSVFR